MTNADKQTAHHVLPALALWGAPLAALAWWQGGAAAVGTDARAVIALAILMALWWITEAVPVAVTALLPLLVLPLATGSTFATVATPYASSIVFLFMAGCILGLGLQHTGLHRRLALHVLVLVGASQRRLLGALMGVTAFISLWISNTATALMIMPIALSVAATCREHIEQADAEHFAFGGAMVLGIAYAASIGGMGTPIGTPTNLVFAAFLKSRFGIEVGMVEWMRIGLPMVCLLLAASWLWLCHGAFRLHRRDVSGAGEALRAQLAALGPTTPAEWRAGGVFALVAAGWVLRPQIARWFGLPGLEDSMIGLAGVVLLFLLPARGLAGPRLIRWEATREVPWDILLLLGGGITLAGAITSSGADAALGTLVAALGALDVALMGAILAAIIVFSGELTSNVAAATALSPLLGALCAGAALDPVPVFLLAAFAGSCGFMLPVATPPNAIAFASGLVPMRRMVMSGLGLNLICIALIVLYTTVVLH